jgi:hypothetical protein
VPNIPKCAKGMTRAVKTFSSKNPKHLRDVRFVVFQREMFNPFYTTLDAESETKTKQNVVSRMLTHLKNKVHRDANI